MRQINSTNQCFSSLDFRFVVLLKSCIKSQTFRISYRNRSKCVPYRLFSVEKVSLSSMNVSIKLDNAIFRYFKLKSAWATLARRKSLSNLNNQTLQDWLRQVRSCYTRQHQSTTYRSDSDANAKQWLMSSPNICPFPRYRPRQIFVGMWFRLVQRSCLLSTEVISLINIAHCLPPCQGPVVAAM